MTTVHEACLANAALKRSHKQLTAVFTGVTKGIGLATLQAFAKHVPKPTAIIVGRSRSVSEPDLQKLKDINPKGHFNFIEGDVGLIKSIDAVSTTIKALLAGNKIDLLYLSQGFLPFDGRRQNVEGLGNGNAVRIYGRSATGLLGFFITWMIEPLANLFMQKPADVGERMLYYGTTEQFAKGSWALDEKGTPRVNDVLKQYRKREWPEKVWEHMQSVFEQALSR